MNHPLPPSPIRLALLAVATMPLLLAQPRPVEGRATMSFEEYNPVSMLKVPGQEITRAKFPFIDVHNHQRRHTESSLAGVVREMDAMNMAVMVNLSGGSGTALREHAALMEKVAPGRFVIFANINFDGIDDPEWGARTAAQLERDVKEGGARGLKVFKNLGMTQRDKQGKRVPTNDPRIDPVWAKAGELGIPVLIHTAEPAAFFLPLDKNNERWLELTMYPTRARPADRYPSFETLMAEQHAVFRKHRNTTFINAHLGWYGHDLAQLGRLMDEMPNMVTELGAVIYEPARQPRFARQFFIKYQDRILMGKDSWVPDEYRTYFRVLESADEYFPYHKKYHAYWRMYGLDLPDEVLKKVYHENALRVIPGIDRARFPR
ncbi:MAG: amidohydrolase family protein [Opitutaceae bacterium]|nr:amidohydrolase family protein [Opitutaceae bacterium]